MAQLSLQRVLPTRHETTTICRAGQTCSEGLHTIAWNSRTIGGSRPAKGSCLTSLSVCRLVAQRDSVDGSSNVDSCSASVEIVAVFPPYSRQGRTDIRSGSSTQRGGGNLLLASACTSKHIERLQPICRDKTYKPLQCDELWYQSPGEIPHDVKPSHAWRLIGSLAELFTCKPRTINQQW